MTAGFLILAICVALLGNALFSGSEIAVLSTKRSRIEALIDEGSKAARRVKLLQDDLDRFLATAQIGVTLCGTLAGVFGGYLASLHLAPLFARWGWTWVSPTVVAIAVVATVVVYLELVLGKLVPKAFALRFAEPAALLIAWPLRFLLVSVRWFIALLTGSTRAVLWLFGLRSAGHHTFVSEEEIKHLVKEGRAQGVLDQSEMEMIHGVFAFSETAVRKVMVPRPKVFALDVTTPPGEVERQLVEGGFSRIPVYESSIDNVIGLVYVKDALRLLEKRQPVVLRKILHPTLFVPETKKVGELLRELQKRRSHMALVVDEHGSMAGLVTMEDLLEELVGEIEDEYDWEERPVEKMRDGSMVVDGTLAAAELRDTYEVPIPESEEFETVAGFMLASLGTVPRGGEVVNVDDWRLTVVDVEKNRVTKVKIERG